MFAIHNLARGLIFHKNHLLIVKTTTKKGKTFYFLPGGHIEYNESVSSALSREFMEEMGVKGKVKDFVGIYEHSWDDNGSPYHEINFVFTSEIENPDVSKAPKSCESHLEFEWVHIDNLSTINLLPEDFKKLIPNWLENVNTVKKSFISTM